MSKIEESKAPSFELETCIGMTTTEAAAYLSGVKLQYLIQGDGDYVTNQIPAPGTDVKENDIVLLVFD